MKTRTISFRCPEEIFEEKMIRDLYDIDNGFFDPLYGSIELPAPKGEPKTMVLSSCGTAQGDPPDEPL